MVGGGVGFAGGGATVVAGGGGGATVVCTAVLTGATGAAVVAGLGATVVRWATGVRFGGVGLVAVGAAVVVAGCACGAGREFVAAGWVGVVIAAATAAVPATAPEAIATVVTVMILAPRRRLDTGPYSWDRISIRSHPSQLEDSCSGGFYRPPTRYELR